MRFGSVAAGYWAADLKSLVRGSHRNENDGFAYMNDAIDRLLAGGPNCETLRPDVGKYFCRKTIQIYLGEERQSRAEVKAVKQA